MNLNLFQKTKQNKQKIENDNHACNLTFAAWAGFTQCTHPRPPPLQKKILLA